MIIRRRLLAIAALLLAGCAGAGTASYSEADNKKSIEVDQGNTFTVSLPDPATTMAPVYSPTVLALLGEKKDDAAHRRIFEFQAKMMGETEIRIVPNFSLKVRVVSSSDRPGMHINH